MDSLAPRGFVYAQAGGGAYLYRAVDSAGETIEFMFCDRRLNVPSSVEIRVAMGRSANQDPHTSRKDKCEGTLEAGPEAAS